MQLDEIYVSRSSRASRSPSPHKDRKRGRHSGRHQVSERKSNTNHIVIGATVVILIALAISVGIIFTAIKGNQDSPEHFPSDRVPSPTTAGQATTPTRTTTARPPTMPPQTRSTPSFSNHTPSQPFNDIEVSDEAVQRFQAALRFRTISFNEAGDQNRQQIEQYNTFLLDSYPAVFNASYIQTERINELSLLISITGNDTSLQPYLLMGHTDVVPAPFEDRWDAPPFSGDILNGYIYGRGTIDAKHIVMGVMEALDNMVTTRGQPSRGFYVALGHDEEIGGRQGHKKIAELLESRGVRMLYIIDEGSGIFDPVLPGIEPPVALVSVTEKGYLTLNLTAQGTGGHSSLPTRDNPVITLADAVSRLHKHPVPSRLGEGPEGDLFHALGDYLPEPQKSMFKNIRFYRPMADPILSRDPGINALSRTTTAVTIFNGGNKANILPSTAYAIVNHRIHPVETVDEIIAYDTAVINDSRIQIEVVRFTEPPPISPSNTFGFHCISQAVYDTFPEVINVLPMTLVGASDTRHYHAISDHIYRFSPVFYRPGDTSRLHGFNERIGVENYRSLVNVYARLLYYSDVL